MRCASSLLLLCVAPVASTASAQFVRNTTDVPPSAGSTEQVDFADVDLDGDWDAAFANGGGSGNDQSRVWINLGGVQGGILGHFADETAARFPAVLAQSRDIEFADFDADDDPDLYLVNDSAFSNQGARFWVNQGGPQGGTIGTWVDETSTRWVGLGQAGSSLPPSQVLAGGGFTDYSSDGDFADLDGDGDLDLVHTSHGPAFNGDWPTRLFLNDGNGFFSEFNPSGFQLAGSTIANGNPGLWAEGIQTANTTNSTGAQCDIATTAINADWGDVDGDLDVDLLLGARGELPRMFRNRGEVAGGLPLRDVTGASFVAGYSTGGGHYEECFADLDGDDDLDIYGVNWRATGSNFVDAVLRNDGQGYFAEVLTMASSSPDDEDADPIDFDLDGDLDLLIANFAGQERIVRNNGNWSFSPTSGLLPSDNTTSMDADSADVDGDGDPDVFVTNILDQPEWYLQNVTTANDVHAPRVARLEQAPDRVPGPAPTVVRGQVYDNAALYTVHFSTVANLELRVDAGTTTLVPLRSSNGQVFRAEIDGTLAGLVAYRAVVTDEHGNTGTSAWKHYAAGLTGTPFCSGDGTATACPCGNTSLAGRGCGNSLGVGARLVASGSASVAADTFQLAVEGVPNSSCLFFQGTAQVAGGAGTPFGDGLRCAGGTVARLGLKFADSNMAAYPLVGDAPVSIAGSIPAGGGTRHYQVWYRNAADFCTAATFNLSNGWTATWVP